MSGYITGFAVYTLAVLGLIFVGLVVVKKTLTFGPQNKKANFLKIETSLNIEPRKNLYVVKAGRERFLISSSGEGCQFMTKLEDKEPSTQAPAVAARNENLEEIQEYFNYGRID